MGTLYIVSTPIGNLKDITLRAIDVLKAVDLILCEDTRVTGLLLKHLEISKKMVAVNDFNEEQRIGEVILNLKLGKNIALVSDAGTPLVSDPGYKIVREAINQKIRVESIPGPSAVICALALSGMPSDKFMFVGYLSKKDGKRKTQLTDLKKVLDSVKTTFILYESPYRVVKTLGAVRSVFGGIDIVICRELTKLHEEIRREKITESLEHFEKITPKGEFVIIF
jgi:16S rRNA (cytidine1402-2'-O)-methyltransferase